VRKTAHKTSGFFGRTQKEVVTHSPLVALSRIYALDFGTQNVRIAIGTPGKPIEIQANAQSSRATPNFLAYAPSSSDDTLSGAQWVVGVDAERIVQRNSSRGTSNPFYYLADRTPLHSRGSTT
jgi:hypothetical protein